MKKCIAAFMVAFLTTTAWAMTESSVSSSTASSTSSAPAILQIQVNGQPLDTGTRERKDSEVSSSGPRSRSASTASAEEENSALLASYTEALNINNSDSEEPAYLQEPTLAQRLEDVEVNPGYRQSVAQRIREQRRQREALEAKAKEGGSIQQEESEEDEE